MPVKLLIVHAPLVTTLPPTLHDTSVDEYPMPEIDTIVPADPALGVRVTEGVTTIMVPETVFGVLPPAKVTVIV
jgi:hypothetical protein